MKKILLLLSSAALMAAPLATVVACGDNSSSDEWNQVDHSGENGSVDEIKSHFNSISLESLASSLENAGITLEQVKTLTLEDIQKHRTNDSSIDATKKQLIYDVYAVIQKWAFDNNLNKTDMEELLDWQNSIAINVFNSQSEGRGPWTADPTYGKKTYYRNDHMNVLSLNAFGGEDWVGSSFKGDKTEKERVVKMYNNYAAPDQGEIIFDPSLLTANNFATAGGSATSFSIYRTVVNGEWISKVDPETGEREFTEKPKTESTLFDGLSVSLSSDGNDYTDVTSGNSSDLQDYITDNPASTHMKFSTEGTVNYAIAESGEVKDSSVQFKAKDLFYGLARSLYAVDEVRRNGEFDGVDISAYLPALTDAEMIEFKKLFPADGGSSVPSEEWTNKNGYLYGLYGVDILKTFETNINGSEDEFTLVFKDDSLKASSLGLLENNSAIQPFPASEVKTSDDTLNATSLQLSTYGQRYKGTGSTPSADGVHTLAPFVYTDYTWTIGKTRTMKMNKFYADQTWVKDDSSILEVGIFMKTDADAGSYATARANAFVADNVTETHEYIIDFTVPSQIADQTLIDKLNNFTTWSEPTGDGINTMLTWNPYGFNASNWNALGREMMWGESDVTKIPNSHESIEGFYYGSGAVLRQSINQAVNWHTMAQEMFSGSHHMFYPIIPQSSEVETSGLTQEDAWPTYLPSNDEYKDQYNKNRTSRQIQWQSPEILKAAATLDELATEIGATSEKQAQIPIFSYSFTDQQPAPEVVQTKNAILQTLNSLTDKVKFVEQQGYAWTDFVAAGAIEHTAATTLLGVGEDYDGVGSAVEQFNTYYGSGSLFSIALLALENNK